MNPNVAELSADKSRFGWECAAFVVEDGRSTCISSDAPFGDQTLQNHGSGELPSRGIFLVGLRLAFCPPIKSCFRQGACTPEVQAHVGRTMHARGRSRRNWMDEYVAAKRLLAQIRLRSALGLGRARAPSFAPNQSMHVRTGNGLLTSGWKPRAGNC
jgi:hypothetical protein